MGQDGRGGGDCQSWGCPGSGRLRSLWQERLVGLGDIENFTKYCPGRALANAAGQPTAGQHAVRRCVHTIVSEMQQATEQLAAGAWVSGMLDQRPDLNALRHTLWIAAALACASCRMMLSHSTALTTQTPSHCHIACLFKQVRTRRIHPRSPFGP